MTASPIRALSALVLTVFVLSACGRAGDPLRPSEAARQQAKAAEQTPPPAPVANKDNPDKRFILDGLLE